jgi:phage tail-like protein
MTRKQDWLIQQLPVGMVEDEFLVRFLRIFQGVADTLLDQIDTLPHMFDVSVAPLPMVRQLGRWIGVDGIDPDFDPALQRRIVRDYAEFMQWRGTKRGLRKLLELLSDGEVSITDNCGIYVRPEETADVEPEEESPPEPPHLILKIPAARWVGETRVDVPDRDVLRIVRNEVPAFVTFELHIGDRQIWPERGPSDELTRELQEVH